ncbi:NAD(P)-binding Rossmann-like domain-containing protein [Geodermatophilus obscurus]|uniref:NAD(P)-binding Rossmann-like domain-containing protein n=1 Tax=Geodermatophilus obscurus TaxID=1861 RepID=A0A1I5HYI4_9ACTN|nr:NAD(P)-binding protein [Geodermatophilus obscurus]SFO53337.1 NAD(P)-binding Rossmann-like domain-containing protein [Geodermatophilus obscurus]
MHVGVAGAGIGGLVLARALRARGVEVTVFERDRAPGDTAGYRLHLDPAALAALRRVLPAGRLAALLASGVGREALAAAQERVRAVAPVAVREVLPALRRQRRLAWPPLRVLTTGLVLPAVDRGPALDAVLRGARVTYPAAP